MTTTGVWLIGARGSVAVTSVVGALALRAGLAEPLGCVTELPELAGPGLPDLADLVFGGHDISDITLDKKVESLVAAGVLPARPAAAVADKLAAVESDLRPAPVADTQAEVARLISADIDDFRRRHGLARVVVVNVSSTEPAVPPHPAHLRLAELEEALTGKAPTGKAPTGTTPTSKTPTGTTPTGTTSTGTTPIGTTPTGTTPTAKTPTSKTPTGRVLPPSSLYAYAAFRAGCPYVDFTPSTGARLPALRELADAAGLPYAGHDGKTGETLVKSVLAPMFAMRNLRVRTWSGTNLLGGGDGANLADPAANAAKAGSKQRVLAETLGYQPQGSSHIEFVDDIGDFKTAWDLITFRGFLGTSMRMEFSWHGCDSALAAPLLLDLARLTAGAHAAGRSGPLTELAFFFKDPLGETPHALPAQWDALVAFARGLHEAA